MFGKLLKHDLRALFKHWWIGAVISFAISVLGGVCLQIVDVDYTEHESLTQLGALGLFFSVVAIMMLPVFTEVLAIIRYYKNFFSDEGYLTFTLPVKKTSLLDSKLAATFIFTVGAALMTVINFSTLLAVGVPEHFFDSMILEYLWKVIKAVYGKLGFYGVPYTILGLLTVIALVLISILFVFVCITVASAIAKKHKVIAAIGIYYGANICLSLAAQIMSFGGVPTVLTRISELEAAQVKLAGLFVMTGVLGIMMLVFSGLYLLLVYLLDKRLNLE